MIHLVFILELIGTVAFAVSGAIVGLRRHMDLFGVCILGIITACGGGLLRDLMLGRFPPAVFCNGIYALIAMVVSVLVFIVETGKLSINENPVYKAIILILDSVGLGTFTVVGIDAVIDAGFGTNMFFTVALGVVTGVGGGLLRDIMAGEPPYIFVKHIYACASLIGGVAAYILWFCIGETAAYIIGIAIILLIRLLAAHYKWSLPRA